MTVVGSAIVKSADDPSKPGSAELEQVTLISDGTANALKFTANSVSGHEVTDAHFW